MIENRLALLGLLVVTLSGCSTNPPSETSVYLLRATPFDQVSDAVSDSKIGIGEVRLADYLNEDGIVLELGESRINHARYHLWAEPLRSSVKSVLADDLARQLDRRVETYSNPTTWDHRVDVYIDQLHGTADGQIKLAAYWLVTSIESDTPTMDEWQHTMRVDESGYDALVDAHKDMLADLAGRISGTLQPIAH